MKITAIYDNGGKTFDRYTVVFDEPANRTGTLLTCLGLSHNPEHPQGFSQFCSGQDGDRLGRKIPFEDLPKNIQTHIKGRLQ